MSGAKRKGKYRKSITDDYLNDLPLPESGDVVAQCQGARGSNIFEIALTDAEVSDKSNLSLCLLPNKFRNVIWVKTRDFLILESAASDAEAIAENSSKVKYIIKHILNKNSIKNIEKSGLWPVSLTNPYSNNGGNTKLTPVADKDGTGTNDTVFSIESNSKMGNNNGYMDDLLMPGYQEAGEEEEGEEVLFDKRGNIITEDSAVDEETAP